MKLSPFTKKVIFWASAYTILIRGLTLYVLSLETEIVINPPTSGATDTATRNVNPVGTFNI